jgi:hypothetical protein
MKTEFIQPRFDGARFAEHTLPLEVAKDLAAYETLVVELAKHLYLQDHPGRQRVPKGFDADFHLHLEKVDDGSAKPMLSVVAAGVLALGAGGNTYFEKARDLITDCVQAPEGQLPESFPRNLLSHFNQIGRSLRADEYMELPGKEGAKAVLNPDRRKHLVLAAEKVYEREIELLGTIGEADWEKSTFRLRLADGAQAVIPMPESFHSRAREYGGRARFQVTVTGVATFDSWDKLQKVVSVETLEIQPNHQISAAFDSLSELQDGWLDGAGLAPNREQLSVVAEELVSGFPEHLALPAVVPTPEGNLLLEWNVPGSPSVDIDLASLMAEFHAFTPDDGEIEKTFDLSASEQWKGFFYFLESNVGEVPA